MKAVVKSLVAIALTLTPMQASAECAWILWRESSSWPAGREREVKWQVELAVPDALLCIELLTKKVQEQKDVSESLARLIPELRPKVTATGQSVTLQTKDGTIETSRFVCIPDTLDPRVPRGTAR